VHPHNRGLELISHLRRCIGRRDHIAATDINLIAQRQRHGLTRHCLVKVAIRGDNARDTAERASRADAHARALPDKATGDQTRETTEIQIRPVHPLHRQAERRTL